MPEQLPNPITMVARHSGNIRVHTFVAAFTGNNIANASHIIESRNKLVLIDGQFLADNARAFRAYADKLGKPIERLYVSHRHPDHWFGLATAFSDVPIYALQETKNFIKNDGEASRDDHLIVLGPQAPASILVPSHVVAPGEEAIDGVKYVFSEVINTEIDFLLTIGLPELGIYIAQDLLYSGTHLYLTKDMPHWIDVLQEMLHPDSHYDLFLPGHGFPADKFEVARNIEYLVAAQQAFSGGMGKADFETFLTSRYPGRLCQGIFDIYLPRLFDGAAQF